MDTEYLKKLQTMKPSEYIEEVFGIKLLQYQKYIVDTICENSKCQYRGHRTKLFLYDDFADIDESILKDAFEKQ